MNTALMMVKRQHHIMNTALSTNHDQSAETHPSLAALSSICAQQISGESPRARLKDAVAEVLCSNHGVPMSIDAVWRHIISSNSYDFTSCRTPKASVSGALSSDKRFKRVVKGYYLLNDNSTGNNANTIVQGGLHKIRGFVDYKEHNESKKDSNPPISNKKLPTLLPKPATPFMHHYDMRLYMYNYNNLRWMAKYSMLYKHYYIAAHSMLSEKCLTRIV